jgi:serine/threonine protein phosphatase PrpC
VHSADERPAQAIASARIALVRVLTYYDGRVGTGALPTPAPSPCASDGVLVGTTGSDLNSFSYVLTPTAAINPTTPCQGAQVAFQQLYGRAASWDISHIDVLLNVAYTGTGEQQMGAIKFCIDPAQIATLGGPTAPALQAVALSGPGCVPAHDVPVVTVPQPSDTPADPAAAVALDLTRSDGQLLGRDAISRDDVATTLYPVDLPAGDLGVAAQGTQGTQGTATTPPRAPDALASQLSLGAPIIVPGAGANGVSGRLVGMIAADARGNHVLVGLNGIRQVTAPLIGKPGPLMTQWQQALDSYYASPPQFARAANTFAALASTYPDFGGVVPFLTAARAQSTTIPALTSPRKQQGSNNGSGGGGLSQQTIRILSGLTTALLALLIVATLLLLRRRRALAPAAPPPEEALLNLLPRDLPLEALDTLESPVVVTDVEARPTEPLVPAVPGGIDSVVTLQLPNVQPRQQPELLARARRGLALMPQAAGLTDPGMKRAADPNQDNILAVQGVRLVNSRPQPYGLFLVADGMGGHLNGQEASRLAIEIVAGRILQVLSSPQAVGEHPLKDLLRESVQQASADLYHRNLNERLDMGTTITGALVVDDIAYVINVGDSRTYLMSPEIGLRQVTTDHSVVASLVAAGVIRPEDIYQHPRRNQIYRSLGNENESVEVDTFEVPLQAGDKLLVCSDGLWEMVRDPQIEHILRAVADPRKATELLVREANGNGGEDNISAIVVRLLEDIPQGIEPGIQIVAAPQGAPLPPAH